MPESQNPRMIPIPEEIQGLIKRLFRHTRWNKEAIQEVATGMLTELQRNIHFQEQEMWAYIQKVVPETAQFEEKSLNPVTMVVHANKDGKPIDKGVEIPAKYHEDIFFMLDEIDIANNTAPLIGGMVMGMHNKVDQALAKINTLLRTRIPECADGEWNIDPIRWVAIEGGLEMYEDQINEESSTEN